MGTKKKRSDDDRRQQVGKAFVVLRSIVERRRMLEVFGDVCLYVKICGFFLHRAEGCPRICI